MNQMTPDNYNNKSKELLSKLWEHINDENQIKKITSIVYKKSSKEEKYVMMYTKLINQLIDEEKKLKKCQKKDTLVKKHLLTSCQETFKEFKNPPPFDKADEDSFEKYTAYKKKIMGNIILIANIFLHVKVFKLVTLKSILVEFYRNIETTDN